MKISASISMMFREVPILDRFAAAAKAGFDGVEIQVIDEGDPVEMAGAARAAGMPVVLINLPLGDLFVGGVGLSGVPGREMEFDEAAERGLRAAGILGARFVHIGPSRIPAGHGREECLESYRRNAASALDLAARLAPHAVLLAEPMNRVEMPDALFASIDEAADMVRAIGDARFGLLFDLYHIAMNGDDIARAWTSHGWLAPHVQFSDAPGRNEPGTGSIDFTAAFAFLRASGYGGWYGAEYRPAGVTVAGLEWIDGMRGIVA
ncbi:Hydroxypyruvate isomerase [Sphingobium chlorophenolicum L-1]|uniref:Hydroxypyruvate isomerase n=1 Tax=Sphingobium chlorophenolicum L-1 TaxID=690566 RepID=F6EYY6_SPHCR|nr:TIM barrel protein [Sphingobium chlorophenolicum]AEG48378.1 Hydroxypyruvate isomerase [Sphingobium chlorophenolicum L-1]